MCIVAVHCDFPCDVSGIASTVDAGVRFYAVVNAAGEYVPKSGCYREWTSDVQDARIYTRLGVARGIVTRMNGAANVVEFTVSKVIVLDQAERLAKQRAKKERAAARREADDREQRLKEAQRAFDEAQANLMRLKRNK